ncbi:MAG: radical SAM protein [Nitrospirae bacterium]|nr:radical SAM protein [Nitrospirota bacterium]
MKKEFLIGPPTLSRVFTSEDRSRCIRDGGLLGVALRLPCQCNLKCRYCYSSKTSAGISIESILSFCSQARDLGARTCSIVGDGEPLLFPQLNELISSLRLMKMDVILYSNLIGLSESTIDFLIDHEITLVFKQNSLDEEKQDWLCGVKGTYKKMNHWINMLMKKGYGSTLKDRLSVHTIVCRQNLDEIPAMWKKWRSDGVLPQVQQLSYFRPEEEYLALAVPPGDVGELFDELRKVDNTFGYDWTPRPPIAPYGCSVHFTSCALRTNGDVSICGYTDKIIGNVLEQPLSEIIGSAEVKKMRGRTPPATSKCFSCALHAKHGCYGCIADTVCRGKSYFDEYDQCWL